MRSTPRFFPSDLSREEASVYRAVTAAFAVLLFLLVWPLFHLFNRVRPFVLEMPFAFFAVTLAVVLSFLLLLALYLWEGRKREDAAGREGGTGEGEREVGREDGEGNGPARTRAGG